VDNARTVDVLHRAHDSSNQSRRIGLKVVSLCTDTVKELATSAEIEDEIEIMRCFEVIMECDNIAMASRDVFQHLNFISNLADASVNILVDRGCHR
jgi:hypothetical protein